MSTAFITSRDGIVYNSYQYNVFGNELDSVEQLSNRIRYAGQQYDELTKQYYLRARFYNPMLGRFVQEDVYQGDGLNLYVYCGNNPVVYSDPSGYDKIFDWGVIPSANSGFNEWYDSIDWEDFDKIWKDESLRGYIEDQIRYPGGLHEWNMAGFANYFKYWGVSMDETKFNRDIIATLDFINPTGHHGSMGSTTAHNEIRAIIESSLDYDDFERRLRTWADYRLPEIEVDGKVYPGSARLPGNLQNQDAIEYIDSWYDEHPEEQNKTKPCKTK